MHMFLTYKIAQNLKLFLVIVNMMDYIDIHIIILGTFIKGTDISKSKFIRNPRFLIEWDYDSIKQFINEC
ncbi:hypothetical protein AGMMS49579_01060 [Spirochaetia bacterium]|nr:hypothetical protein AGMMS49579_01060 [Spirochaetia bacterium]